MNTKEHNLNEQVMVGKMRPSNFFGDETDDCRDGNDFRCKDACEFVLFVTHHLCI